MDALGPNMARRGLRLHPGQVLREEYLAPLGINAQDLAHALGLRTESIAALLAGDRGVTPDIALRLARYFATTPQFWLGLQAAYDLSVAEAAHGAWIEARIRPLAA
jgi:addiction module HigA family antidote